MEDLVVDKEIKLKKIKLSDAAVVFETIRQNRQFLRTWLPFVDQTRTGDDTGAYIRLMLSEPVRQHNQVFTIWFLGEFAGLAGYKEMDTVNHKLEIGYWLSEKMQGKGIMTRTVEKMTGHAFHEMQMNRVQIKVAVGNSRSSAIPKRLGFLFEGIERNGEFHTFRYFDLEVYSMLKSEWD